MRSLRINTVMPVYLLMSSGDFNGYELKKLIG